MKRILAGMISLIGLLIILTGCGASAKKEVPTSMIDEYVHENFCKPESECTWKTTHSVDKETHIDTVLVTVKNESNYGYDEDVWELKYQYDKSSDLWTMQECNSVSANVCFNENLSEYFDYLTNADTWNWNAPETAALFTIFDRTKDSISIEGDVVFYDVCDPTIEERGEDWEIWGGWLSVHIMNSFAIGNVFGDGDGFNHVTLEIPLTIPEDCPLEPGEQFTVKLHMNAYSGIYRSFWSED